MVRTTKMRQKLKILPNFGMKICRYELFVVSLQRKLKMMRKTDIILAYAAAHPQFTVDELFVSVSNQWSVTKQTMAWQVSELAKAGSLTRVANGVYALSTKHNYIPELSRQAKIVGKFLQAQFPLLSFCMYESSHISPLQHHLAYTNTIFVETAREGTEVVFHTLADKYKQVFLAPTEVEMNRYLDQSKQNIFVKPLISEAPLQGRENIKVPTIEKLLVDIYCDKDFYYLQGAEYDYIWENARTLYNINTSTILRYAARRGVREEFNKMLS